MLSSVILYYIVGTNVTKIKAMIANEHGQVLYALDDPIESQIFNINIFSGQIFTTQRLNRKLETVHKFVIVMKNSLQTEKQSFVNVIVYVDDINDNRPVFETKSKDIFVEESTGIDRLIAVVRATDADAGDNSRITYIIVDGNNDEKFKIDEFGAIRLKNTLKFSEQTFYSLNIRARDNALVPQFSDILTLRITVKETPKVQEVKNLVDIPVNQYLGQSVQYKEYNIELQPDDPGDEDCKLRILLSALLYFRSKNLARIHHFVFCGLIHCFLRKYTYKSEIEQIGKSAENWVCAQHLQCINPA